MKDTSFLDQECFPISTIGYEGTNIDTFIGFLLDNGIETLVDVRELPLSRKKGFSKNRLREALKDVGIDYVHIRKLGDPKEGRLAAREGDYHKFRSIFSNHMASPAGQAGLVELEEIVKSTKACLLCFERCHEGCHRSIVVDKLSETINVQVENLVV